MSSGHNEDVKLPKVAIKCKLKGHWYIGAWREHKPRSAEDGGIRFDLHICHYWTYQRYQTRTHVTAVRATGLKIVAEPHFETSPMLSMVLLKRQP